MTSHVLECDGLSMSLFTFLAKETRKLESARVFIPPTVVFDQGFASAWYYSTPNMEVKRRNDRDINASDILKEFSSVPNTRSDIDICAVFMSAPKSAFYVAEITPVSTETTYFDKKGLYDFLYAPGEKPRGILQKFVFPKGLCTTSIQAIWSRNVTMTEALRNPNSLRDKTKSRGERGGTFEVPTSQMISITNSVNEAVRQYCSLIVQHLQQVDHVQILGMVLQFRVEETNRVMLLSCTSMRAVKTDLGFAEKEASLPLNMMHSFVGEKERIEIQTKKEAKEARDAKKASSLPPIVKTTSPSGHVSRTSGVVVNPKQGIFAERRMADSLVYKEAALRLLKTSPTKLRSKLVLPTLLGNYKHTGRRWMGTQGSPIPVSFILEARAEEVRALEKSKNRENPADCDDGEGEGPSSNSDPTPSDGTLGKPSTNNSPASLKVSPRHGGGLSPSNRSRGGRSPSPLLVQEDEDSNAPTPLHAFQGHSFESNFSGPYSTSHGSKAAKQEAKKCFADIIYLLESAHLSNSGPSVLVHVLFEPDYLSSVITEERIFKVFNQFNVEIMLLSEHSALSQLPETDLLAEVPVWPQDCPHLEIAEALVCSISCVASEFNKALSSTRWKFNRFSDEMDGTVNDHQLPPRRKTQFSVMGANRSLTDHPMGSSIASHPHGLHQRTDSSVPTSTVDVDLIPPSFNN